MNTHEHQAKTILSSFQVPSPPFHVVGSFEDLQHLIDGKTYEQAVLKVQVHAGGRGKAGGVKLARSPYEILTMGKELIGKKIVNNQTGSEGVISHEILISPLVDYVKEYYLGIIIDRKRAVATMIASPEGGMEIEEVAAKTPEKILTLPIGLDGSIRSYHLIRLAKFMGWKGEAAKNGMAVASRLAKAFVATDASLLEINPLVELKDGQILALDAKLSIDDNALYRHPELQALQDLRQISPFEAEAAKFDLAYVALDGSIGCMVNGAGLAMATMDLIKLFGGAPANFLDVGGSATKEKVAEGFKILLSDPKVKAILVNIFGGIMNCATIAQGVIAAASELKVCVPLVVRLEGTNVEEGRRLLTESGVNILIANDLSQAAQLTVESAAKLA